MKKKNIYTFPDIRKTVFNTIRTTAIAVSEKISSKVFEEIIQEDFHKYLLEKLQDLQHLKVLYQSYVQLLQEGNQSEPIDETFFTEIKKSEEAFDVLLNILTHKTKSDSIFSRKKTELILIEGFLETKEWKEFASGEKVWSDLPHWIYSLLLSPQEKTFYNRGWDETILVLKKNLHSPRSMSGYSYPDMDFHELKSLFLQFLYKNYTKQFIKFRWNHTIKEFWKKQQITLNSSVYSFSGSSSLSNFFSEKDTQMLSRKKSIKYQNQTQKVLKTDFFFKKIFDQSPHILISIKSLKNNLLFFPHLLSIENEGIVSKKSLFGNLIDLAEYHKLHQGVVSSLIPTKPEKHLKIELPPGFLKTGYWFMPTIPKPFSSLALKNSFISKFKRQYIENLPDSLPLNDDTSLFYTEEEILPFLYLEEKEKLIREDKTLSPEEKEKKFQKTFSAKEKKILKNLKQVYTSFSAIPEKNLQHLNFKKKYEIKKWIEQNLNQDNPLNDVKALVIDLDLQKKIYTEYLKKSNVKEISKNYFFTNTTRKTFFTSEDQKEDDSNLQPFQSDQNSSKKEKSIKKTDSVNKSSFINNANPSRKRFVDWKYNQSWDLLPWLPTLECKRKEIVVFLPQEFWTGFLTKKKLF